MTSALSPPDSSPDAPSQWFVLKVRTRSEDIAVTALQGKGYQALLLLHQQGRKYSDRTKTVEVPVFPGYIFCRFNPHKRTPILSSPAVEYILGFGNGPIAVPDEELEGVRRAVIAGAHPAAHPAAHLGAGQRVRVRSGLLAGVEGILVRIANASRLVLSIQLLQRSVAVHVDADMVEAT
jgi:transcription antitermination factor NusG